MPPKKEGFLSRPIHIERMSTPRARNPRRDRKNREPSRSPKPRLPHATNPRRPGAPHRPLHIFPSGPHHLFIAAGNHDHISISRKAGRARRPRRAANNSLVDAAGPEASPSPRGNGKIFTTYLVPFALKRTPGFPRKCTSCVQRIASYFLATV
jgi:hypothetical protein